MSDLDILTCVRDLIGDPLHWTTMALSRDRQGRPVNAVAPDAESFCLLGAVIRCANNDIWLMGPVIQRLMEDVPNEPQVRPLQAAAAAERSAAHSLGQFNDILGHAAVIALLDRTIARERERKESTPA